MDEQPVPSNDIVNPKVELRRTDDGSATLFVPALNEHYHSRHGARQESQHVCIWAGLLPLLEAGLGQPSRHPLRVLEVGLGTGLNALLTLETVQKAGAAVIYDGLETYPLPAEIITALQPEWTDSSPTMGNWFQQLHAASWDERQPLTPSFFLTKIHERLEQVALPPTNYDLIYFDAFAPEKQPEL